MANLLGGTSPYHINNNNGNPNPSSSVPPPPTLDQITRHCGAHGNKYFKSQAALFEYINEQNAGIIEQHIRLGLPLTSSSSQQAQNSMDAESIINQSMFHSSEKNNVNSLFSNSATNHGHHLQGRSFDATSISQRSTPGRNWNNSSSQQHQQKYYHGHNSNNNNNIFQRQNQQQQQQQQNIASSSVSAQNLKQPIEEKLLRPFCVHIDESVAPSNKSFQDRLHEQQEKNQNRFFSISSSGSSSEMGLLAKFNQAGATQKESLLMGNNKLSGSRRDRDDNNDGYNSSEHAPQTRFFVALTRKDFARFARGDVLEKELPQEHQHFFEIIQEGAPCVLYFDVEMEPHTALTKEEQKRLIREVDAIEGNFFPSTAGTIQDKSQQQSLSLKNNLPTSLRKRLRCCPVGCGIEFDETQTRDILVAELKNFINNVFPLPFDAKGNMATIDENSFIVLVSPSKNKFSQHYIIRFKEEDARFANNSIDTKLVVNCFVEYLYDRAFEDPKVHSALFYHESLDKRNCVVSLNSDKIKEMQQHQQQQKASSSSSLILEETSFSNSPAKIRAMQQRAEKEKQQQQEQQMMMMMSPPPQQQQLNSSDIISSSSTNTTTTSIESSGTIGASFCMPAVSLKCIIDEAVYSRNRMMRCYGSSKVGKKAILEFDHTWHQGGRLNHFQTGNKESTLASTLISEPVVTVQDQKLVAAKLFRMIDSEAILATALARGCKAVQGLQMTTSQLTTSSGLAQITQSIVVGNSHPSFDAASYETTNYNSAAALMKFPILCKELATAQNNLEQQLNGGRNNHNNSNNRMMMMMSTANPQNRPAVAPGKNSSVESISLSIQKTEDSPSFDGNFRKLKIIVKIRNNKYCHVIKRQHRSNGIYWIVKCSLPTKNYLRSLETRQGDDSSSSSSSNVNLNGYGSCEQRCFDDDCKGRHTYRCDLSDASLCEVRMVAGLGNDQTSSQMSSKMVVVNRGGDGQYLSAAARKLLQDHAGGGGNQLQPELGPKKSEAEQKKEDEAEKKRALEALKPKATKWVPPNRNNANNKK